jgi:hypothetical protein
LRVHPSKKKAAAAAAHRAIVSERFGASLQPQNTKKKINIQKMMCKNEEDMVDMISTSC